MSEAVPESTNVTNDEATQRFEVHLDGAVGLIQYRLEGDRIVYLHTEVPESLEGHGVGSLLARAALDDARRRGLKVVPLCPFVSGYIHKHPEYQPLVDPAYYARGS